MAADPLSPADGGTPPDWICRHRRSHGPCNTRNDATETHCGACGEPGSAPASTGEPTAPTDHFGVTIRWSPEDGEFVATSDEWPGLSGLGDNRISALDVLCEAMRAAADVVRADGEPERQPRFADPRDAEIARLTQALSDAKDNETILRGEVEQLKTQRGQLLSECYRLRTSEAECARLRVEVERWQSAFRCFAQHDETCAGGGPRCSCGYSKLVRELDPAVFAEFDAATPSPAGDAPPTQAEKLVAAVEAWQHAEHVHPLTCGNDSRHPVLVPYVSEAGEACLRCEACDYTQRLSGTRLEGVVGNGPPPVPDWLTRAGDARGS